MKKIFINSISKKYLIGTYTFLESLKKYNHDEDVHILYYEDVTEDDLKQIKEKEYPFKIYFQPIIELREKYPIEVDLRFMKAWDCRFYQHRYALNLDFDVVCFWNGDMLLLDNISQYLDIGKLFIILSQNYQYRAMKKLIGQEITELKNPFADVPFITSDRDIINALWEIGQYNKIRQRGRGDMWCLYESLKQLNKFNKVFSLPYSHWIDPARMGCNIIQETDGEFYLKDGSRVHSVHGPLWSLGHASKGGDLRKKINLMFHKIYVSTGKIYDIDEKTFR